MKNLQVMIPGQKMNSTVTDIVRSEAGIKGSSLLRDRRAAGGLQVSPAISINEAKKNLSKTLPSFEDHGSKGTPCSFKPTQQLGKPKEISPLIGKKRLQNPSQFDPQEQEKKQ